MRRTLHSESLGSSIPTNRYGAPHLGETLAFSLGNKSTHGTWASSWVLNDLSNNGGSAPSGFWRPGSSRSIGGSPRPDRAVAFRPHNLGHVHLRLHQPGRTGRAAPEPERHHHRRHRQRAGQPWADHPAHRLDTRSRGDASGAALELRLQRRRPGVAGLIEPPPNWWTPTYAFVLEARGVQQDARAAVLQP